MYPNKNNENGWIRCPSKSFPGKFYFFNVVTGETAWCLNENERKMLKNSPMQRIDHEYPEPSSPPIEEGSTNMYQTVHYPYPERTISNYPPNPQEMYPNSPSNFSTYIVNPYDSIPQLMSGQIPLPMIWPSESSMPQVVMVVMNQAMQQLAINRPRGFRQPQLSNRGWNQPNYVFQPNLQCNEPYQLWNMPNQPWPEPKTSQSQPKEPDRKIPVHSGKAPLCKRFVNFKEPVLQINDNKVVRPNQYDPRLKNQHDIENRSLLQPMDRPGPSNLNINQSKINQYDPRLKNRHDIENRSLLQSMDKPGPSSKNQPKINQNDPRLKNRQDNANKSLSQPIDRPGSSNQSQNHHKNSLSKGLFQNGVPQANVAKKHLEKQQPDRAVYKPNSNYLFGKSNFTDSSKNKSKTDQSLFGQNLSDKGLFGQRQIFGQDQAKQLGFEKSGMEKEVFQNQIKQMFRQNLPNRELFGQSQTKQLFGQSQREQETQMNHQSFEQIKAANEIKPPVSEKEQSQHKNAGQTSKVLFGQSQTKQLFGQSQKEQETQMNHQSFEQIKAANEIKPPVSEKEQSQHKNAGQTSKVLFGQSQTNQLFKPSQNCPDISQKEQSKHKNGGLTSKVLFGQIQTNQVFKPSQNCLDTSQTDSFEANQVSNFGMHDRITEESPSQSHKVDFPKSLQSDEVSLEENHEANAKENANTVEITPEANLENLDENDLRRVLIEKKRKSKSDILDGTESKRIKTSMKESAAVSIKKKVTFNLDSDIISDSFNGDEIYNDDIEDRESQSNVGTWYTVADTRTLLEDFHILDTFVKSDPTCILMIPSGVMSDIETLSKGKSLERKHVALSRHLLRTLANPQPHIIVQKSNASLDVWTDDSILNSCVEVMDNTFVALITNDEELQTKAKYLNITCFTTADIKSGQAQKSGPSFDIKKNTSVDKEPKNVDPTQRIDYLSFGDRNLNWNKKVANTERFDYSLDLNAIDEIELNNSTMDIEFLEFTNSNMKMDFELNSDQNVHCTETTTLKTITNPDKIKFLTNENNSESANRNVNSKTELQSVTFPEKEPMIEQTTSSIFKQANDKIEKSIFEVDNDELVSKCSIFEIDTVGDAPRKPSIAPIFKEVPSDSIFKSIRLTKTLSNFETGNNENSDVTKPPLTDIKKNNENQQKQSVSIGEPIRNQKEPSVFGMENKENQPTGSVNENVVIKNKTLEQFLEVYYEKNRTIENLVEERKTEVGCCFKQIMEECLNHVLQDKIDLLKQKYNTPPPWTLSESLQCLVILFDKQTYIQDVVSATMNVFSKGEVTAKDVIRTVGCGIALVKYLMFITPITDVLKDADVALGAILKNLTVDTDITRKPELTLPDDTACIERNTRNFVKDRLEVVKYLKKHFAGWADYDETSEEYTSKPSWKMNYSKTTIVRTYGKNLGMLKLSNTKPITMEPDSSQNIDKNARSTQNYPAKANFENNEKMNDDFANENVVDFKLSKVIKTETEDNFNSAENNDGTNQTEPKIVRLWGNIDLPKNNNNKMSEINIFDDIPAFGHTFGTVEENGPKLQRTLKPIKEFEEKFNFERKPLDLDDLDYSVMSKSDENNNLASESTNNNNISMSLENNGNSNEKLFTDALNDLSIRNDVKNDCSDARNDINLDSYQNSSVTNIESSSMSIEPCITNNIYGTINIDDILSANDIVTSKLCNNFDNMIDETNNLYDIDAMNDDFKRLYYNVTNDMTQKDDATVDSRYESANQTYYVMDTFLAELQVAFKGMHKFLKDNVSKLRSDKSLATKRIINGTATMGRNHLGKIIKGLRSIIERESSNGPRLRDIVAGAGSILASDERIYNYKEIVTKCYDHGLLIDRALGAMIDFTDDSNTGAN